MTTQLDRYLLDQAARLVQPLQAAGASPDAALRLAAALGWDLGAIAGLPTDQLASAASAAAAAFSNVEQTVEQGPADLPALAATLLSCATAFADLRQVVQDWTTTDTSLPANLLETFADDLFAYLFDIYLSSQLPRLRAILQVAGVYQTTPAPAITRSDGTVVRRGQARPTWNLDLLIKALTDPPAGAPALHDDRRLTAGTSGNRRPGWSVASRGAHRAGDPSSLRHARGEQRLEPDHRRARCGAALAPCPGPGHRRSADRGNGNLGCHVRAHRRDGRARGGPWRHKANSRRQARSGTGR